mmetsp:Transcript_6825/g.10372  ORF Transcript_6825/g.10372 Transcript_6825/m.10372 type:complete len:335 (-) Transcript_6825:95-1099(-)
MISLTQTFHRSIINKMNHHLSTQIATTTRRRLRHTVAISREIPDSFIDAISFHYNQSAHHDGAATAVCSQDKGVSLLKSREQHTNYLNTLRQHIPINKLICLPPLESHPDCLFVEDTMVAIQDTVVLTRMGHESRRGEVDDSIKSVLCELLGLKNVYDMNNDSIEGCCDGGDVLYTGRHLFVGITNRTNQVGFQYLRNVFAHHDKMDAADVVPIPMMSLQGADSGGGVLHLKSAVTHIDEETLLIPEGEFGDILAEEMKVTERGYTAVRLPDVLSCNAVVVNGHVMAQDSPCSVSKRRIEQACHERDLGVTFVDTSELAKKDAALTCCSVLLSV